jgi:uncharacterized membrane protein YqaE (UPF0057 family)
MPFTASDICKIIFAVILPPLGVFLERGCGSDLLINILLTVLGVSFVLSRVIPTRSKTNCPLQYLPGIVHALWIICRY